MSHQISGAYTAQRTPGFSQLSTHIHGHCQRGFIVAIEKSHATMAS